MSGYSKRMMEIAAVWHAANPDPSAPLQLPRKLDELRDLSGEIVRVDASIEKARRAGRSDLVQTLEGIRKRYEDLVNDPELSGSVDRLSEAVNTPYQLSHTKLKRRDMADTDDPVGYATEAPWLLAWARDGYNVFDLSPDFVAAMLLTDPREIDLPSLKLPFRGMLFTIPDGFAIGTEGASYTKIHVAEIADSRTFGEDLTTGREKRPAIVIYATDGHRLLATVAPRADLSWDVIEELPGEEIPDLDKEAQKTLQRIALGALAYATAVDRAITDKFPENSKRRRAQSSGPSIAHWTIGRTIKIEPELVRVARSGSREIAFKIKSRFIVRGHYRNQAHGEKRALRTMKWIAPFWKGPEEGAKLVHTYKPSSPMETETNDET